MYFIARVNNFCYLSLILCPPHGSAINFGHLIIFLRPRSNLLLNLSMITSFSTAFELSNTLHTALPFFRKELNILFSISFVVFVYSKGTRCVRSSSTLEGRTLCLRGRSTLSHGSTQTDRSPTTGYSLSPGRHSFHNFYLNKILCVTSFSTAPHAGRCVNRKWIW